MATSLRRALVKAEAMAGQQIEQLIRAHHRRRLTRAGHGAVLAAPAGGWAETGCPKRAGNRLEVLIDGAEALPRIAAAIEGATRSVWLAGWFFSPDFRLRPDSSQTLRDLLASVAERVDVRMLAWAGAPLPVFRPDRRDVRSARTLFVQGSRIRMALDAHERPLHCHHEKLVIVDGDQAFVGGLDLTFYGGDRLDDRSHPARGSLGWHDVATLVRGPVVVDIADHFRLRWQEVTGECLPKPIAPGGTGEGELQIVRTIPEGIYAGLPSGEFTILESYLRGLRSARRLVYLENQFLWSPEVVSILADKLRAPPDDRFRLLILLPEKANNGKDDTRGQLGVLADADGSAGRMLACTLHQVGPGRTCPVYVHAKVAIVDDRWLTIGSANLNEYSLFNDTEMNVVSHDAALVRATRLRLWSEHLDHPVTDLDRDPADVIDTIWRPLAEQQLQRRQAHRYGTHKLVALPGVSRRSEALRGPLDGLLVDA